MLLIGSRAAKHHFPFFRRPMDYDFLALKPEVENFLSNYKWEDLSSHDKKIRARVELDRPTIFEFELADQSKSAEMLYHLPFTQAYDPSIGQHRIMSPDYLFLLKKTHIPFNIHFKKNISDYLFLKSRVNQNFDSTWQTIFDQRFEETKERVKFQDRNFDVDNSDFFKISEKMVKRQLPHDNIHWATCFYNRPLFMEVKDDLSRAEMNPDKVWGLSHRQQIQLIQEEAIALSIERYIIPSIKQMKLFKARQSYIDTCCRMVHNYLPMWMRFFAADHFSEIIDLKVNYVDKFLKNVQGLNLPHENLRFAQEAA